MQLYLRILEGNQFFLICDYFANCTHKKASKTANYGFQEDQVAAHWINMPDSRGKLEKTITGGQV